MGISANKKYKESGSELSFKDWLKNNQKIGLLSDHNKMFNADGENNIPTPKLVLQEKNNKNNLFFAVLGLGLLFYGINQVAIQK